MLRVWMFPLAIVAMIAVFRLVGVREHLMVPFVCGFAAGFWLVLRRVLVQRSAAAPSADRRRTPPLPPAPIAPRSTAPAEICPRCGKRKASSR
jgi:hypothetical protein